MKYVLMTTVKNVNIVRNSWRDVIEGSLSSSRKAALIEFEMSFSISVDNMVEDMDVDLDKEFLQELKELKILITDKDLLDQHKR